MTLDFYFDFSSPYGYILAEKLDPLAARYGHEVAWFPFLIGAAFKQQGIDPPVLSPLKHDYFLRDFARSSAFHGVPFRQPTVFPISSLIPNRAYYALQAQDPALAKSLAQRSYRAYFTEDRDISKLETVLEVAKDMGLNAESLAADIQEARTKDKLRQVTELALSRGVFGSPFVFVGTEAFWGADRLDQIERWLAQGAW